MKKKEGRYKCNGCDDIFKSWQARSKHVTKMHPPPKKIIDRSYRQRDRILRLQEGDKLKVGDKIRKMLVGVVSSVGKYEGEDSARVTVDVIEDSWGQI